ncbi:cytochrome c oxidase subunit 2A [Bacillaceae bacterium S4-13-58]
MPTTKLKNQDQKVEVQEQEPELKGTLYAVLGLGAFIIISWFIVWGLFVGR